MKRIFKLQKKFIKLTVFAALLASCQTTSAVLPLLAHDKRSINIQTLNLFNQRSPSYSSKENWKGDWFFRRQRLQVVDHELRAIRPDVILFQEALEQSHSKVESDRHILESGSLKGYEWEMIANTEFGDTDEKQYHATALALPLSFAALPENMIKFWKLGDDGYLTLSVAEMDHRPILFFNVQMPSAMSHHAIWYSFIEEQMERIWKTTPYCRERTVLAGNLVEQAASHPLADFLARTRMKDTAAGFCELARDCYTATSVNELFQATTNGMVPEGRYDRILVHSSAIVNSARVNFNRPDEAGAADELSYGLAKLWPSTRYGWHATVRLSSCSGKEP
jgi:endonuclease/exonuclease/phosphatase family metal-dependent hydrolase